MNELLSDGHCDLGVGIALFNTSNNRVLDNQILHNGPYGGITVIENSDGNLISGNVVLNQNVSVSGLPRTGCGNNNQDEGIRIEGPGLR